MVAAKEKTFFPSPDTRPVSRQNMRPASATSVRLNVKNRISNCDFRSRKFQKPPIGLQKKFGNGERNIFGNSSGARVISIAWYNGTNPTFRDRFGRTHTDPTTGHLVLDRSRIVPEITLPNSNSTELFNLQSLPGAQAIFSHPPNGGFNFDFYYHAPASSAHAGTIVHANQGGNPRSRVLFDGMVLKNKNMEEFLKEIERYQRTNTFNTVVHCATCQQSY